MKKKRRRRKKKEKRKKRKRRKEKRGEKTKEEAEIEEIIEEEHGDHGDDKLKSSKANEWGKLGWNWNRNKEECEEKNKEENWRIGEEIARSEMGEKKRRGMKSNNNRKRGKCQGILRKSWQWCNWDMKRMRRVRKKKKKEERRKK